MDSQPQTGKAFQDLVVSDVHIQELNLESRWVARILPIRYDLVKYHLPIQGNCIFVPPLHRDNTLIGHCKGLAVPMDSQFQTGEAFQDLVELDKHNPELSLVLQGYYLSLYSI
jgi:hypothetical protein